MADTGFVAPFLTGVSSVQGASVTATLRCPVAKSVSAASASNYSYDASVKTIVGTRPFRAYNGLRASSSLDKSSSTAALKKTASGDIARRSVVITNETLAVPLIAEPPKGTKVDELCINSIRFLAIDAVEKAKSGHPGLPMGCAPMSYVLWNKYMKYNPKNPNWINRDRFVLSAGHGCMLQYALLHLTGFDSVGIEDLKQFRQWDSKTPGHPESFITEGVEVTTGPLGQGIANAVGLAMAEAHCAARFNKPDAPKIVDHYTYCILGDGCNMEGVSGEACSLAGHQGLGKLIALYDDNKISIDGHTDISFTEDVSKRFEAYGWHTIHVQNGNGDLDAISKAIEEAKAVTDKPTFIKVSTTIGYGSPNLANTHSVHGAALGDKEVGATRKNLNWEYPPFVIPEESYAKFRESIPKGAAAEAQWQKDFEAYKAKYPTEAAEFEKYFIKMELPEGWEKALPTFTPQDPGDATRNLSGRVLNILADEIPTFLGGSADLAPSNMTLLKKFPDFQKGQHHGRNLRFGVREFGMGAICNGILLHDSGLIPYCATFFVFTDYMRGAMRLAALSEIGVIYVMTHDSLGVGEDGPTHQPIEHLASHRCQINLNVMRPADGNEVTGAYKSAILERKTPTLITLTRQKVPNLEGSSVEGTLKGAYILTDNSTDNKPDIILMGTGSETQWAAGAAEKLRAEGVKVRVVSFPCWELFEKQSDEYKESVFPKAVKKRVAVEAGCSFGWSKWVTDDGATVTIDTYGASAPGDLVMANFGFTLDNVYNTAKKVLSQ
mmetsp:Transcript_8692/g.14992  ORF Transcript_8692/g.14992 Transcript_8692/m.14992 type:complete len:778 (-) Transcript_8692:857-3190(-)